jgi:3-(3-hydroxy-phenyl)propionate hydroxylase
MRPAGRGELESLYFDYPHFHAPATRDDGEHVAVAIVGAGPVGLLAALALAQNGVRSALIEQKDTFNDGSRAVCLQRQSFHILERMGALKPFLEKALGWTTGRTFYQGRQILEFDMAHDSHQKFLPMYNLQQQYIEQYLYVAAMACGLIEFRWQTEAIGLDNGDDAVTLRLRDPAGDYDLSADWLLAADGARSSIRGMLGLRLAGQNFEGRYAIADIRAPIDYPTARRAFFDPASNPGRTILLHRQPEDIWRVDYQLEPNETTENALKETAIRANVEAILAEIGHDAGYELEWWSVYTANTLALDKYRHGRTLFIGDSAHIVPIFGVRGLNNGLADAENVAWKLARVLKGEASDTLLDSFAQERRDATMDVFANAGKSMRFMTPPSPGWRLVRDAALSLALDHEFARPFANPRQMTPFLYAKGGAILADDPSFSGGPAPGDLVPNFALNEGGYLSDKLGLGFVGLWFGTDTGVGAIAAALSDLDPTMIALAIGEHGDIPDIDGQIASGFAAVPGDFYLVRPDMYVAGRWRKPTPEMTAAGLADILYRPHGLETS